MERTLIRHSSHILQGGVTIKLSELAKLAHVSTATVSLVLNNRPGVNPQTRERITSLLLKYGYEIKLNDTIAKEQLGHLIFIKYIKDGLLVEKNGDFISSLIDGIVCTSKDMGYELVIKNSSKLDLTKVIEHINLSSNAKGVIVLGTECDKYDLVLLEKLTIPFVVVDNPTIHLDIDTVVMNNEEAAFNAVRYLYELGHTHIGLIKSSTPLENFSLRESGFIKALHEFDLKYTTSHIAELIPTLDEAYHDMKNYIARTSSIPTAFFACNDCLAIGAMHALKEAGFRIPEDISIIGFDNISSSLITEPPLTTMNIYKQEIGHQAVMRLTEKIQEPDSPHLKILVSSKLIVRGSSSFYKNDLTK